MPFPRQSADDSPQRSPAPANAVPAPAPPLPWWRAMLDAVAAAPGRQGARGDDEAPNASGRTSGRRAASDSDVASASRDNWRPVTERLDRHREQLAGIDDRLRQLVDLQSARQDATAVYAPPA